MAQCVDSIRNQTIREIEIILIDDGSPDGSPQMCDQFAAEDERIQVLHQDNQGVSVARNRGMQLAKADWLMFVDPDDWLEKDAVEVLFEKAVKTDCDIICAAYYENFPQKQTLVQIDRSDEGEYLVDQNRELLFGYAVFYKKLVPLGFPWGKIYRRAIFNDNTVCFPCGLKRSQDIIFNLYALNAAKAVFLLGTPIYHYRRRADSISHVSITDWKEVYSRYISEVYSFVEKNQLWNDLRPVYNYTVVGAIVGLSKQYSKHFRSIGSFCMAASRLKLFCQEDNYAKKVIADTQEQSIPYPKQRVVLWLLKRRMYKTIILLGCINSKLTPLNNK